VPTAPVVALIAAIALAASSRLVFASTVSEAISTGNDGIRLPVVPASAPSRRPRHWCVGARDRAGQREYRDVDERPHEDGPHRSRREDDQEKEGQAQRQLALTHKTAEAADSELDLGTANVTGPDKSDAGGEYEPEQEAGHRDAPETRKPRASLTG
jgi:hypothetical protein